jgi:hypothetical protein
MPTRAEHDCPEELDGNPSVADVVARAAFEVLGPTGVCELLSYRCRYGRIAGVTVRGRYESGVVVCRTEIPHPDSLRGPRELARDELVATLVEGRSPDDYERAREKLPTSDEGRLLVRIHPRSLSFVGLSYADAWAGAGTYEQTFVILSGEGSLPSQILLRPVADG